MTPGRIAGLVAVGLASVTVHAHLRDFGAVGFEDGEGVAVELRGPAGEVTTW
jgi:hypothetical protein